MKKTIFQRALEEKNLKYTQERQVIYDEVHRLKKHFDSDSLYDRFRERGLRISRDTVYRTMPLLLDSGVIQKSVGKSHRDFYELVEHKGHHDHMVCTECGKVVEFQNTVIEQAQKTVAGQHGFLLRFHDHRLFGVCPSCQ